MNYFNLDVFFKEEEKWKEIEKNDPEIQKILTQYRNTKMSLMELFWDYIIPLWFSRFHHKFQR